MTFCRLCLMSDTRPDLHFDEAGVCDACCNAAAKAQVDWRARSLGWFDLATWAKAESTRRKSSYDCVVAVSGGKDSHFIVLKALEIGLFPLLVSFEPSGETEIGRRNLANLQRFADLIQIRKNRKVYQRLRQIGLEDVGDSEWPNHLGIFTGVIREAVQRDIPLVIWGENPQAEYGGPEKSKAPKELDRAWLAEFGGLLGMRLGDMRERGFAAQELAIYEPAADSSSVRSVFLGDYFPWDSVAQASLVQEKMGFSWSGSPPFGAAWLHENLDDTDAVVFHDFLALAKFGYSRAHQQLSIEVRHGHKSLKQARESLIELDVDRYPPEDVEERLAFGIDMPCEKIRSICRKYLNPAIWQPADLTPLARLTRL